LKRVKILHNGKDNAKVRKITFHNHSIVTPTYFASITSAASRVPIGTLLTTLTNHPYSKILVSSYDIYHKFGTSRDDLIKLLNEISNKSKILFLDSGIFEQEQLQKDEKDWNFDYYQEIASKVNSHLYASFDVVSKPTTEYDELLAKTLENIKISKKISETSYCFTIVHGNDVNDICKLVTTLGNKDPTFLKFVAVTEKECGKDIQEMYSTIKKIRITLDKFNKNSILHVLGCGDPITIAVLAYAGADTFDAVDWNRWLINNKNLQYINLKHAILLDCDCKECINGKYEGRELSYRHNLTFYEQYLFDLQNSIYNDNILIDFLKDKKLNQQWLTKIQKFINV